MSDQDKKQETTITPEVPSEQPAKPATGELTNKELSDGDKVAGGLRFNFGMVKLTS